MSATATTDETLRAENAELRARLAEAEEMLRAIRAGEVDALVVESSAGPQLFTLQGLDAEQNRFRGEMLAQVSDAVIAVDPEERVTFLNAAAERKYRVRNGDVLGRKLTETYVPHWPSPEAEAAMWTALRERGEWRGELIQRTHDGRELHVEKVISTLHAPDGTPAGYVASIRDITERKRMDQRLWEEEHRLRLAMAAAATGMWDWDVATNQVVWTPECYVIHGVREGEFDGTAAAFDRLIHPDDRGRVWAAVTTAVERGTLYESEFRIVRPNGEVRWVTNKGRAINDGAGVSKRMVGTITDITERKQAEEALRANEHFLQRITEVTPGVLHVFDIEKQCSVFVSRSVASVIGYSAEEIAAMGSEVIPTLMHPDDVPGFAEHMQRVRTLGDDESADFEHRMRAKSGDWRWFQNRDAVFARDETGAVRQIVGAAFDVTARKQIEDRLRASEEFSRTVLQSSPDCVKVLDADGVLLLLNEPGRCLLELDDPPAVVGKQWWVLWPEEARADVQRAVERARQGEATRFEHSCPTARGTLKWWDVQVSPVRNADGSINRVVAVSRDMTERQAIEEELRQTTERFQLALKSAAVTLFEQDLELRYTWIHNPSLGYEASEVIGKRDADLMERAEDAAVTERMKRDVIHTGHSKQREVAVFTNGVNRRYDLQVSPLRDADGGIIGVSCAALDITELKKDEEQLRLYEKVITKMHDVVMITDAEPIDEPGPRIVYVNPAFTDMTGYTAEEVLGKTPRILQGPKSSRVELDKVRAALRKWQPVKVEMTEYRKDGTEFDVELQIIPVADETGWFTHWVSVQRDITERTRAEQALRASQERMRLAAEATGVGIWEWNVITNEIRWDPQLFRIYGIEPTPDGFVHYQDWSTAVLPEDLAENEAILQDTVRRAGQSTREFRIRRRSDGECRWVQSTETVRTNAAGRTEWVVGTNLDVTERKEAEQVIRDEAKRKDEFLAMLGHELRNPLNAIRHAVQIGHETPEDGKACQWASQVIDSQSQQLSRMVDDLLDVARINRGLIELRPEALDVAAIVERAVVAVQPLLVQRRHTLVREFGTHLHVTGDAARLEQVFVNLLTNAAKYTPEEGRISVRAHREGDEVVVVTTDNGTGIPGDLLPHVFELFRQADSTLDRARGGLGIGLNVVKCIVEMHRGRVTVESTGANAGTTVTVRLPLLVEMPTPASAPTFPPPADAPLRSTRVLVVDDHEDAARALAHLLKIRGCEVALAHSGPDGVATARVFLPEVLLIDLGLPGHDGYEVTRRLRTEPTFADALFIAISGYAQDSDRDNCLATGFDAHFSKPLNFPRLMETLRAGADRRPRCPPDQGPQGVESP